jgi:hypothetical protein
LLRHLVQVVSRPYSLFGTEFRSDSLVLSCTNVEEAKRWWVNAFKCKVVPVPSTWDSTLPSDVALQLPGYGEPTILLNDRSELQHAGLDTSRLDAPVIFCDKLKKAHELLSGRGVLAGPIQDGGDTQFFEVSDSEGNVIQVCKET